MNIDILGTNELKWTGMGISTTVDKNPLEEME